MAEPKQARVYHLDHKPSSGPDGTLAGAAQIGDLLVDSSGAALYVCVSTVAATGFSGPGQAHLANTPPAITWVQVH